LRSAYGLGFIVVLGNVYFIWVCMCCRLLRGICSHFFSRGIKKQGKRSCLPFWTPPPSPVILFNLAEPPALILASRRSLRMRACSAALEGGELAGTSGEEDMMGVSGLLSAIFDIFGRLSTQRISYDGTKGAKFSNSISMRLRLELLWKAESSTRRFGIFGEESAHGPSRSDLYN